MHMSAPLFLTEIKLAQTAPSPPAANPPIWMFTSGALAVAIVGLALFTKVKISQLKKQKRFEEFKNQEFQKKLKLALDTISKMEKILT